MSILHWKLGDIALARICKKVYAKVQVIKDEKGLFFDDKVLAISPSEDGINVTTQLCYYVETIRTKNKMWLPYTCLHLAARSRPFYGPSEKLPVPIKIKPPSVPRKRKIKEDHTLPLSVKPLKSREPDLNMTYDIRHIPLKQGKYENAFKEFVRRGKEMLFDEFYSQLQDNKENEECLYYVKNIDASTEDKFEMIIKNTVSEKEIENYLHQCWRYNLVHKQTENKENIDNNKSLSPEKMPITLHVSWCLVCGKGDRLRQCPNCPSSFHLACRREWLVTIIHRKKLPNKAQKQMTFVDKILSSTRTICSVKKEKENVELCPSCMWGPKVGYEDVVWHKLGACPWWPARVLAPGAVPSCLLSRSHTPHQWPLKYYGTENHSWGDSGRMCLFLPSHTAALRSRDETLQRALLDACDDYIAVYLT
ncbi:putative histone-lysine N-methyltransferase Mes-4 [Papilio machaon]|uniref:Putative histone-lysine N-methyltransferase Mes-4 n=1 Tax=Papilio machaon TaxID=76193 RepID=A0A194QRS1_PAPMA|nr:putative histone-lysine N-methyltransferase Mes-4 [Papilio machaon]